MTDAAKYQSPLSERYASQEMAYLFSSQFKFLTWRKLWIALAKGQKSLGFPFTEGQIQSLERAAKNIDFQAAEAYEQKFRHDVMAHIHAFGDLCPEAKGIIHLGATSCFVTDNTDLIQMREGLKILRNKIIQAIRHLSLFAKKHAHLACLSYTHLQPASPTTVGKRACLWLQDLLIDLEDIERVREELRFLGVKGATGTQASFLALFGGDHDKVTQLDHYVAREMGFTRLFSISGQTYTRKQDIRVLSVLSSFAASSHKFATDIRLLAHLKEMEESFAEKQVGSSAMPHKRNPMQSERLCGLARFLLSLSENPLYTESVQWFERSLDDSSNRRLCIPQVFLTADAILNLLCTITAGLTVYPKVIERHLQEELPFLATEHFMVQAVKKGKDRQVIHERLRLHSQASSRKMKEEGAPCDLLERIAADPAIALTVQELQELLRSEHFIGRAAQQVHAFLGEEVAPLLEKYKDVGSYLPDVKV
jgi:adenylosuccinate lyase